MYGDGPRIPQPGELTYHSYLAIDELTRLQRPQSNPPHHDELLFIIIHQAYELWFKLALHELAQVQEHMAHAGPSAQGTSHVLRARHFLNRVVQILKLGVQQIHILETMQPVDFLEFRDHLNPGSGFQSAQFRELEFAGGLKEPRYLSFFKNQPQVEARLKSRLESLDLKMSYYTMLEKLGFKLPSFGKTAHGHPDVDAAEADPAAREGLVRAVLPIYQRPEDHMPLYLLSESLIEFDEYLALWREHHVRVVERVIGFKRGTGGSSGVEYLRSTTTKKCFPVLWELRTALTKRN